MPSVRPERSLRQAWPQFARHVVARLRRPVRRIIPQQKQGMPLPIAREQGGTKNARAPSGNAGNMGLQAKICGNRWYYCSPERRVQSSPQGLSPTVGELHDPSGFPDKRACAPAAVITRF